MATGSGHSGVVGSTAEPRATRIAGRLAEQDLLGEVVRGASQNQPAAALVHGEAGVGKTRLVSEVCAQAARDGFTVLWGRCVRFGAASSPYLPLVSALEGWLSECDPAERRELLEEFPGLAGLLPYLGGGGTTHAAGRLLLLVNTVIARIAARRPTVLVVDDLQWADVTSLDVLAYLLNGLHHQRLVVLGTYRDEGLPDGHPLHGWVDDVVRLPIVRDLPLGRMTRTETAEQIGLLLGRRPRATLVDAVVARSGGNTYLTELLVRGLEPDARSLPAGLPDALRSALLAKWHGLSEATRGVVRLLAVAGRPFPFDAFSRVADQVGTDAGTVLDAVREATQAGVVHREQSGDLWFRHPLLAEVLYGSLGPGEAKALHTAFVKTFEESRTPDTQRLGDLALHYERAGLIDEALDYTGRAAEQAATVQAFPEEAELRWRAAALWGQASEAAQQRSGTEAALFASAGRAARRAGDDQRAAAAIERARAVVDEHEDPLAAAHVITLWCSQAFSSGRLPTQPLDELRHAVELAAPFPDSEELAVAMADLAEAEAWHGDKEAALVHAAQAVEISYRTGENTVISYALGVRSFVTIGEDSAGEDAEECYRLAVESDRPEYIALACITRANFLEDRGRLGECAEVFVQGYRSAAQRGLGGLGPLLATYAALFLVFSGRFPQAREMLQEALASRATGIAGIQSRHVGVLLALRQGDLVEAEAHLRRARELAPRFEENVGLHGPTVTAEYLVVTGRPEAALQVLDHHLREHTLSEPKYGDGMVMWGARAAADWAARARDSRDPAAERAAQEALAGLVRHREAVGEPMFAGAATDPMQRAVRALFEAEAARCHGSEDTGARWRDAVAASREGDLRWSLALSDLRFAQSLLAHAGARSEAAGALREAHALAVEMEAEPLRLEVEQLARAARISLARPAVPPPVEPTNGLATLTRREREVLGHLVAGRSYAEIGRALFISDKTVSVHVSNLLRKTGTANRVEAAEFARRHGMAPASVET